MLRTLSAKAYDCELHRELEKLDADFGSWREGRMSSLELTERIHTFHQGPARELYLQYTRDSFPTVVVALAINHGLLSREEVPAELHDVLENALEATKELE
ncbi:MAG: hypothetical protein HYX75_01730 [Acidobacteria bacterium]|nr:hypothetical protein [Acidobacteriota bacterium]